MMDLGRLCSSAFCSSNCSTSWVANEKLAELMTLRLQNNHIIFIYRTTCVVLFLFLVLVSLEDWRLRSMGTASAFLFWTSCKSSRHWSHVLLDVTYLSHERSGTPILYCKMSLNCQEVIQLLSLCHCRFFQISSFHPDRVALEEIQDARGRSFDA